MHQMESVSQSQPAVARDNRAVQMMLQRCSHHIVAACVAAECFCQIATWGNFIWSWSPRLWPDAVPESAWKNITFKSKENGNEAFQFCYIFRNWIKIQIYILGQIKSEIKDQWLSFVALSISICITSRSTCLVAAPTQNMDLLWVSSFHLEIVSWYKKVVHSSGTLENRN